MEQIILFEDKPVIFDLNFSFSYIKIEKIFVQSMEEEQPKEWGNILGMFNLHMTYFGTDNSTKETTFNLLSFFSPYNIHPVFEFNKWEIPEENVKNITSFGKYYKQLKISLIKNSISNQKLKITIFYESSPGVKNHND